MVDPPAHARAAATLDPPREDSLYCVISKIIGSTSGVVNGRSGVCRIPLPGSQALPRWGGLLWLKILPVRREDYRRAQEEIRMEEQRRLSRGRFLRLSAMTAGGLVLAGCSIEEGGGGPPGSGGDGGEDVDISKIQAGQNAELEKLAEDWKPYDGEPVEISVWMYPQDQESLK